MELIFEKRIDVERQLDEGAFKQCNLSVPAQRTPLIHKISRINRETEAVEIFEWITAGRTLQRMLGNRYWFEENAESLRFQRILSIDEKFTFLQFRYQSRVYDKSRLYLKVTNEIRRIIN